MDEGLVGFGLFGGHAAETRRGGKLETRRQMRTVASDEWRVAKFEEKSRSLAALGMTGAVRQDRAG